MFNATELPLQGKIIKIGERHAVHSSMIKSLSLNPSTGTVSVYFLDNTLLNAVFNSTSGAEDAYNEALAEWEDFLDNL